MQWSHHFEFAVRPLRPEARRDDWIDRVLRTSRRHRRTDAVGRISYRRWGYIAEAGLYLRVVTDERDRTIITVHFDRSYTRRRIQTKQ